MILYRVALSIDMVIIFVADPIVGSMQNLRIRWILTRFLTSVHIVNRVKHAFFCYVKYREIFAWMATVEFLICTEYD